MEDKEDIFEHILKKHLKGNMPNNMAEAPLQNCLSELELSDYLENKLNPEKEDRLLEHITDCAHCLSLLEIAQRTKDHATSEMPSQDMIQRAKDIMQKRTKRRISHYKWQILSAISFLLSFIFRRYFVQFLALAVIFSIKWIFDSGSTRTLIMIYEAWRKKEKGTAQRIIHDFQDKIEKRS